jgi:hypothetical protein
VNEGCDLYREVTMNEAQLVKAIKTLVEKGDKARDKAEQFYVAAGQHLKTLKAQCSSAPAWEKLVKAKCGLGKSRAYFSRSVMVAPRSRSSELQRRSG